MCLPKGSAEIFGPARALTNLFAGYVVPLYFLNPWHHRNTWHNTYFQSLYIEHHWFVLPLKSTFVHTKPVHWLSGGIPHGTRDRVYEINISSHRLCPNLIPPTPAPPAPPAPPGSVASCADELLRNPDARVQSFFDWCVSSTRKSNTTPRHPDVYAW